MGVLALGLAASCLSLTWIGGLREPRPPQPFQGINSWSQSLRSGVKRGPGSPFLSDEEAGLSWQR